ncbi:MAG: ABC transporter ATP-binding protein [Desulfomicrobium apsheronum]|nr:ABC transporter ATP-binding protein [Desulfomicrobium apsheronum]
MLEIAQVSKSFQHGNGRAMLAVSDLNLTVREGEFVCVVGTSGCGKTTTLRMVAGLEIPSSGSIILDCQAIQGPGVERCVVFQRYTLYPWRSVLDNVAFGLEVRGMGRRERRERAGQCLDLVGLADQAGAYPHQLSGGMQQRVAVARALAVQPRVLLMDEPFGALDARTRVALQCELVKIWEKERKTILFITHSIAEAVSLADRVVVMRSNPGRITDVLDIDIPRPRDRHSRAFREYHAAIHALLDQD